MSRRRRSRAPRQVPSLKWLAERAAARAVLAAAANQTQSTCTARNLTLSAKMIKEIMPISMRASLLRAAFNLHREEERFLCEEYFIRRVDPHRTYLEVERDYRQVWGLPDGSLICNCCGETKFVFYLGPHDECC
ncbi:hypothetical protein JYU34_000688 [Plutella xylostella]|uniref:Uncharacterized protein n=1 Tax=Plutella xylostella TaxID=51655 RepID=A0ABQ7R8C5_PLUXY|nr:hypothetical protein JYU34_000688 [Plutella xylostella]